MKALIKRYRSGDLGFYESLVPTIRQNEVLVKFEKAAIFDWVILAVSLTYGIKQMEKYASRWKFVK